MPTLRGKLGTWDLPHVHMWKDRGAAWRFERRPWIRPETRIATIGSCFAQELAAAMGRLGLNGATHPGGVFYTPRTIRQELDRIFAGSKLLDDEPAWLTAGGWVDPIRNYERPFATEREMRTWVTAQNRRAGDLFRSADVIVCTLGLIESWWHPVRKIHYRSLPHPDVFSGLGAQPHRLTTAEIREDLERVRDLVRSQGNAKLIVTVSPVPLYATITGSDVRVANTESKARLRAAVSEFVDAHEDVGYFQSYEIVNSAERQSDFMLEDGRHVSREGVSYILATFLRQFGDGIAVPHVDESFLTRPEKTAARVDQRTLRDKARHAARRIATRVKRALNERF